MDKSGFGYDGIFDNITTHGRSHLSLLRKSYQKSGLKREKIIYVNLKVAFTAGLCLCWLLSFLFFLAPVFSSFSGFCLFFLFLLPSFLPFVKYSWEVSNFLHTFFFYLFLCLPLMLMFSYLPLFFHLHLLKFHFLPLTSFHVPLSSTNIFSCSTLFYLHKNVKNRIILLYLVLQ